MKKKNMISLLVWVVFLIQSIAFVNLASAATTLTIQTLSASEISSSSARLNGSIISGAAATKSFSLYQYTSGKWISYTSTTSNYSQFSYVITGLSPDTKYYYYASAQDSLGVIKGTTLTFTTLSATTADRTPPTAPSNLQKTSSTSSSISLSWTASTDNVGVTGYNVYRSNTLLKTVTGTSTTDTGLFADTTYSYYVKAKDAVGNISAASNIVSVTTLTNTQTTPTLTVKTLAASAITSTSVRLNGIITSGTATNAMFLFFRNVNGQWICDANAYSATINNNQFSYDITGLLPNTYYYYRTRATGWDSIAGYLNADDEITISFTTLSAPITADTTQPTTPSNLQKTNSTSSSISLSWTASTDNVGVTSYNVYRAGALIKTVTGTSVTDTGLLANTTYSYYVRAIDAAGNISWASNTLSAATSSANTQTLAVETLVASAITSSSAQLNGIITSGAATTKSFSLYQYSSGNWASYTSTTNNNQFSYIITGLLPDTKYYYYASARNSSGVIKGITLTFTTRSATTIVDTTQPSIPSNLKKTSSTSSSISLSWTASTDNVGVTSYNVYRAGALIKTVTGTSVTDTGLLANTTYSYYVRAKDAAGNISWASNTLSAATSANTQTLAVETLAASEITSTSARLNGSIISGNPTNRLFSFCRYINNQWVYDTQFNSPTVISESKFTLVISGLQPNTQYYYYASAQDSSGWKNGALVSFTTADDNNVSFLKNGAMEENTNNVPDTWYKVISWSKDSSSVKFGYESSGVNGTKCITIEATSPSVASWSQKLTGLKPISSYVLTGQIKAENIVHKAAITDTRLQIGANFSVTAINNYDGTPTTQPQYSGSGVNTLGTFDYKEFKIAFTSANDGTAIINCSLGYSWNESTGKVYFDNIKVIEDTSYRTISSYNYAMELLKTDCSQSGISESDLKLFVDNLSLCYDHIYNLVGNPKPFGGYTLRMRSVDYNPGVCIWAYAIAGNPILIGQPNVQAMLTSFYKSNDWGFGAIHEISHTFDFEGWNYHGEVWANFKLYYAMEVLNGTVIHGKAYTGSDLETFFKTDVDESYDKKIKIRAGLSVDSLVYVYIRIKNTIGWEPFKQTYRQFNSTNEKPNTKLDKFNRFLQILQEKYNASGNEVINTFPSGELEYIRNNINNF